MVALIVHANRPISTSRQTLSGSMRAARRMALVLAFIVPGPNRADAHGAGTGAGGGHQPASTHHHPPRPLPATTLMPT